MSSAITLQETMTLADMFVKSGFFSDVKQVAQAVVKIQAGNELGLPPFASMTGIHIIQGKAVLGANVIATLIANHPAYGYRVLEASDTACELEFFEHGDAVGRAGFTMKEAKDAGLTNKDNWRKYPSDMLFARAISRGARRYAPGIFGGAPVYTPDEFGVDVDEDGDVIVVEPQRAERLAEELTGGSTPSKTVTREQANGESVERPWPAEYLRDKLLVSAMSHDKAGRGPTEGQAKMIAPHLEGLFTGKAKKDKRAAVTEYLFGVSSTKELSPGEVLALENWMNYEQTEDEEWLPDLVAVQEAEAIYVQQMKDAGQLEMPVE